jgi:ribose-phosphate pyrophosphokinase
MKPLFFAFPGNELLTSKLIEREKGELGEFELRNFPDGETYIRIHSEVLSKRIILVCSLNQPDAKLLRLFLFVKTLKSLGAGEVILITPYLAYMRQDKLFHPGESLSSHYIAEFLSGFIDQLITVDPHLHRITNLSEVYTIKTKVVNTAALIANWINVNVKNAVLIGPDSESEQWVKEVANQSGSAFTILEKNRSGDKDVKVSVPHIEKYRDYTPVLVDDIVSTGRTMIETITQLKKLKMKPAVCIVIHPVFAGTAYQDLLDSGAETIVSCNTIEHASNHIDISQVLNINLI